MNAWNETEAQQDGQPIVACGGIMVSDDWSVSKLPFTAVVYWSAEAKDWLRWDSGLSVRRTTTDEVIIHYWMPYPLAAPGAQPAHLFNDYAGVDD